jgi:hypothetical protein
MILITVKNYYFIFVLFLLLLLLLFKGIQVTLIFEFMLLIIRYFHYLIKK